MADAPVDAKPSPAVAPAPVPAGVDQAAAPLKAGDRVRFTRGKKKGTEATVHAVMPEGRPVLRTDDGLLLTENPAVLQRIADAYPKSGLAPQSGRAH